jgi:hypothetical protein
VELLGWLPSQRALRDWGSRNPRGFVEIVQKFAAIVEHLAATFTISLATRDTAGIKIKF